MNNNQHMNNKSNHLTASNVWFFSNIMMKQPLSVLYSTEPWITPNENRSINGNKLRYNNRPLNDIELQFPPMHPNLIEITLQEVLARLQYNQEDIGKAIKAFKHFCKTPVGEDGLNISEYYNSNDIRELWEKLRCIFSRDGKNDLCRGYTILADLAFTLISCPASEAQCERYISSQKLCLCKNITNVNQDYLESIWLIYSHRNYINKINI